MEFKNKNSCNQSNLIIFIIFLRYNKEQQLWCCWMHTFCFVGGSWIIYVIYIYLRILVSNTIFISNDVRVA